MALEWPKMIQNGPKMTQNYPKWPKNDARIYAIFPQFFLTEKAVPQTFSLLECMNATLSDQISGAVEGGGLSNGLEAGGSGSGTLTTSQSNL